MLPVCVLLDAIETEEEKSKFTVLYDEYQHLMYYVSYQILGDVDKAEDCVQDSFLKIIGVLHSIEQIRSNRTKNFILTITKNQALNVYNKNKRIGFRTIVLEELKVLPDTGSVYEVSDAQDLKDLIALMPEKYRAVLELVIVYGRDSKQLAKLLGASEDAVRKRLERARKMLKLLLKEKGEFIDDL